MPAEGEVSSRAAVHPGPHLTDPIVQVQGQSDPKPLVAARWALAVRLERWPAAYLPISQAVPWLAIGPASATAARLEHQAVYGWAHRVA